MADNPEVNPMVLDVVMASPAGIRLVAFMARARDEPEFLTHRWMRSDISELLATAADVASLLPQQRISSIE